MHTCRLLILDDDEMIGTTIQLIAEAAGATARLTTAPAEFFDAVADWQPTHICTDLNMPAMDGLQVLTELARRHCRAQVIVSSGIGLRVLEAAARTGAEQGLTMCGVLPKPFAPVALRQLLQMTLPAPTAANAAAAGPAQRPADPDYRPDLAALEQALRQRELSVVYQPKVHCASGQLAGLEALVRWQHPVQGWIGPDRFIPLAEEAGCIDALTLQVLEQALDWFVPWRAALATERAALTLSVNLSARSLGNPALVTQLRALCQSAGLEASRLVFELTETAAMDNPALALELLTRLRVQGFQLSIDDFGTGYSSMVQLVRLPFSEIKVDRSFVMTAARSEESRAIIRSIVGLGHSLGLRVTAEGVEDAVALAYLRDVGCDEAQGYFLARPMPAAALDAWAADHRRGGETERLAALEALHLLDSPPQPRFKRLVALAQRALGTDIAMINLVDATRQWTLAAVGIEATELPIGLSVCAHALQVDGVFTVDDLAQDPRFMRHPMVQGAPFLRTYAGVPLRPARGPAVGTLCVIDTRQRVLSDDERALLQALAAMAESELAADASQLIDESTGLLRQRAFDERAAATLRWAGQAGLPVSLLLIEIADATDAEPSQSSEAAAAVALRGLAKVLSACAGEAALVARHGARQLAAMLPGTTHAGAQALIQAIAESGRLQHAAAPADTGAAEPAQRFGASTAAAGHTGDLQSMLAEADAML